MERVDERGRGKSAIPVSARFKSRDRFFSVRALIADKERRIEENEGASHCARRYNGRSRGCRDKRTERERNRSARGGGVCIFAERRMWNKQDYEEWQITQERKGYRDFR